MNTPTIEERHDVDRWRRHDIVYDPVNKHYGTISDTEVVAGVQVAAVDFGSLYLRIPFYVLDQWQKTNDEVGHE